jgi:HAMP domain-containing protein
MLGGAIAGVAIALGAAGLDQRTAIALIAGCAFASAAVDAHLFGFGPPFVTRQVNEEWLSKYRPWVYGGGFGWQIGVGVATYVMTSAVPLMIAVGALGANAWEAIAIGTGFGLARGLAVLIGTRLRTPAALLAFHRRFDAWGEPVRRTVIGAQLAVAVIAAWIVAPVVVAAAVSIAAAALLAWSSTTRPQSNLKISTSTTVATRETSKEPAQPRRLEKNRNTAGRSLRRGHRVEPSSTAASS